MSTIKSVCDRIPVVDKCCECVKDLKTATVIILVLNIVTSPLISWIVVRHLYTIRVSCTLITDTTRPGIVDINLSNALSFGLGGNASLGPSCLSSISPVESTQNFILFVRYSGWVILTMDVIVLITSLNFLLKIFQNAVLEASKFYLISALCAIILNLVYGILYVTVCILADAPFPIFELFFTIFDFLLWMYFLIVVYSYRRKVNVK